MEGLVYSFMLTLCTALLVKMLPSGVRGLVLIADIFVIRKCYCPKLTLSPLPEMVLQSNLHREVLSALKLDSWSQSHRETFNFISKHLSEQSTSVHSNLEMDEKSKTSRLCLSIPSSSSDHHLTRSPRVGLL